MSIDEAWAWGCWQVRESFLPPAVELATATKHCTDHHLQSVHMQFEVPVSLGVDMLFVLSLQEKMPIDVATTSR
jgi:hypothetical protein